MSDIRDIIQRLANLSTGLRLNASKALFDWLDACRGDITLNHLALYQTQRELGWAIESLQKIKDDVDHACSLAEASVKGEAA